MGAVHLQALQALLDRREITPQAARTIRGQLYASKSEPAREEIMRRVIANIGKRHARSREEAAGGNQNNAAREAVSC